MGLDEDVELVAVFLVLIGALPFVLAWLDKSLDDWLEKSLDDPGPGQRRRRGLAPDPVPHSEETSGSDRPGEHDEEGRSTRPPD